MLTSEQTQSLRPKLLSIQMIAGALLIGVILFSLIICLIIDWEKLGDKLKMLTLIGAVTGLAIFALSLLAPSMFASDVSSDVASDAARDVASDAARDPNPLDSPVVSPRIRSAAGSLVTECLIRYALIEAAIFLNLMVFFIEPHLLSLVVVGIGVGLMVICFPTQARLIRKIEDRIA